MGAVLFTLLEPLPMFLRFLILVPAAVLIALTSSCTSLESKGKKPSTLANNGYR